MSKKKKIIDRRLISQLRVNNTVNSLDPISGVAYNEFKHNLENPALIDNDIDFTDWATNAFSHLMRDLSSVNSAESAGRIQKAKESNSELENADLYEKVTQDIAEVDKLIAQTPHEKAGELMALKTELLDTQQQLKASYDSAKKKYDDYVLSMSSNSGFGTPLSSQHGASAVFSFEEWKKHRKTSNDDLIKFSMDNIAEQEDDKLYWDKKMDSSHYRRMSESPGMSLFDINTYLYKVPGLLGSSASSFGGTATTIGASAINPIVGAAVSVGTNVYSRDKETSAELFEHFSTALTGDLKKAGAYDDVIKQARDYMIANKDKFSQDVINDDEAVANLALSGAVPVNNTALDRLSKNRREGLDRLYANNMALSTSDIVQDILTVTPLGSVSRVAGKMLDAGGKLMRMNKVTGKLADLSSQLGKNIKSFVNMGVANVDNFARKQAVRKIVSSGGRTVMSSVLEGGEEGAQYIFGDEYKKGLYDDYEKQSFIADAASAYAKSAVTQVRAIAAGLTPWDPVYSNDAEFMSGFKGGVILGGTMTAGMGGVPGAVSAVNQYSADKSVAKMYADGFADKSDVHRDIAIGKILQQNKADRLFNAVDALENEGIEGITPEMIRETRENIAEIESYRMYKPVLDAAKTADVNPDSDEFNTFVALLKHHQKRSDRIKENSQSAQDSYDKLLNSEETNYFIKSLISRVNTGEQETSAKLEAGIKSYLDLVARVRALKLLNKEFDARKEWLQDYFKDNDTQLKGDITSFHDIIRKDEKELEDVIKESAAMLKGLGITEDALLFPKVFNPLLDAATTLTAANVEQARADTELYAMSSGDKEFVNAKIKLFNESIKADDEFANHVRGKLLGLLQKSEQTEEEIIPETIDGDGPTANGMAPAEEKQATKEDGPTVNQTDSTNAGDTNVANVVDTPVGDTNGADVGGQKEGENTDMAGTQTKATNDSAQPDVKTDTEQERTASELPLTKPTTTAAVSGAVSDGNPEKKDADKPSFDSLTQEEKDEKDRKRLEEIRKEEEYRDGITEASPIIDEKSGEQKRAADGSLIVEWIPAAGTEAAMVLAKAEEVLKNLFFIRKPGASIWKSLGYADKILKEDELFQEVYRRYQQLEELVLTHTKNTNNLKDIQRYSAALMSMLKEVEGNENSLVTEEEVDVIYNNFEKRLRGMEIEQQEKTKPVTGAKSQPIQLGLDFDITPTQSANTQESNEASDMEEVTPDNTVDIAINANETDTKVAIEEQPEVTTEQSNDTEGEPEELHYDKTIDSISHQLNFLLTEAINVDGVWTRKPKKFQDMEEYLNNDDFAEISARRDFVEEVMQNGVEFVVKDYKDKNGNVSPAIYAIFKYKGKEYVAAVKTVEGLSAGSRFSTFNKLPFERQELIRSNLKALRDKILHYWAKRNGDESLVIVPTAIQTTYGRIVNEHNEDNSPKLRKLTESAWLDGLTPDEITPENVEIGIGTGEGNNSLIRIHGHLPISAAGASPGAVYLVKRLQKPGQYEHVLPIRLNVANFKGRRKVVEFLYSLLISKDVYYKDVNGVSTSFMPKELLTFFVNFGEHTEVKNNSANNASTGGALIDKQFFIRDGRLHIGRYVVSMSDVISNPEMKQWVMDYIENYFHFHISEIPMQNSFLGDSTSSKNHDTRIPGLQNDIKYASPNGKIVFVPGELEFTAEEVGLKKSGDSWVVDNPRGMSLLGYYIKHGWLLTNAADELRDANIYVDDVMLVRKSDVTSQSTKQSAVEEKPVEQKEQAATEVVKEKSEVQRKAKEELDAIMRELKEKDPQLAAFFEEQDKLIEEIREDDKRIAEERARFERDFKMIEQGMEELYEKQKKEREEREALDELRKKGRKRGPNLDDNLSGDSQVGLRRESALEWLKTRLGVPVEVVSTVVDVTEAGARVLGRATEDSILLSEYAPVGTEYHEAYHRVSLLLISDKKRRQIYDAYKKKHGRQLTDAQVEEMLAEDFRSFMNHVDNKNNSVFKYNFDTKNWFRRVFDFTRLFSRVKHVGLAKLMYDIATAKYLGAQPTAENIERFRKIYDDGANLIINGERYSSEEINDVVRSFVYKMFGFDFTRGFMTTQDVKNYSPNVSRVYSAIEIELKRRLANGDNTDVLQYAFDNFESVFLPKVIAMAKRFGFNVFIEENSEITNIEEGVGNINIGQHTIDSTQVKLRDTAPTEVKLFFATIPEKINPHTGMVQFFNEREVWSNVIKNLHNCRTSEALVRRVAQLAEGNLFYERLLRRLLPLHKAQMNKTAADQSDAEAMMSKILTVVTQDVNNYVIAKAEETIDGETDVRIIGNRVDRLSVKLPKLWTSTLTRESGLLKETENGFVATEHGLRILDLVANNLLSLYNAFQQNNGILDVGGGKTIDFKTGNINSLKSYIVSNLNAIGISIDTRTVEAMLQSGDYGKTIATDYEKMNSFVTSKNNYGGLLRLEVMIRILHQSLAKGEPITEITTKYGEVIPIARLYESLGFVKYIAQNSAFVQATDKGLSDIGADNSSYYMVSQNSFVKDRVNELLTDKELLESLRNSVYQQNSLILKDISSGNKDLQVETFIAFKDASQQDDGRDYHKMSEREDYIFKLAAILSGRIVFPTIADKKTYHTLRGIHIPSGPIHMRKGVDKTGKTYVTGTYNVDAINVLIGYAEDELRRVELTLRQVDDNPEHFRDGVHYNEDGSVNHDWLPEDKRIKNYHTPVTVEYKTKDGKDVKKKVEPNGTRFLGLTGVFVNGEFINFNDPNKTSAECLEIAKQNFFNLSHDAKVTLLSTLITKRVKQEIQHCKSNGILQDNGLDGAWSLRNNLLPTKLVEARKKEYMDFDATNAEGYAIFDILAQNVIGTIISVNEVEKIFNGDPAFYKIVYGKDGILDSAVDKVKRLGGTTSTGINTRYDFFVNPFDTHYTCTELDDYKAKDSQFDEISKLAYEGNLRETVATTHKLSVTEIAGKTVEELENTYPDAAAIAKMATDVEFKAFSGKADITDATVFISPRMYENLMRAQGKWGKDIQEAFRVLTDINTDREWENNPMLYNKARRVILNSLKYVAFGNRFENGVSVPYFNKMAMFPLFAFNAKGDLAKLYKRMTSESSPIDMVMFKSAVKVGSVAKSQKFYNEDGTIADLSTLTVYTQPYKYIRQQLATDPHTHEEQMTGTQFMKVALANLNKEAMYGREGNQSSGEEIYRTVMNSLKEISNHGLKGIIDETHDSEGVVDKKALIALLKRKAAESGANDNILDALTLDENGEPKLPFAALSDNSWVESEWIAHVNKEVVDVNMPGGAYIQRTVFGTDVTQQNVIEIDSYLGGKKLRLINDNNAVDAVVSINLFKHIIPDYHTLTFYEARQWLIEHNIIGENAQPNSIGYRIPTQALASIQALQFVDVFPEIMGDTIMLPEGWTALTGSDFDVDKLFVTRFSYNNDGTLNNEGVNAHKNALIESYMKILLTKGNTNTLKLSIDVSSNALKEILTDIESNREVQYEEPYQVYSPKFQSDKKQEYTKGKDGIGPSALNNANQVLSQLTGLKFNSNAFTEAIGITNLDRIYDQKFKDSDRNVKILDWLCANINAFVDIAKDPYIVRLNINPYTFNMAALLLRTGIGERTFYFLTQPILVEVAKKVNELTGKYGIDAHRSMSDLRKEAIDAVLKKYDPSGKLIHKYRKVNKDDKLKGFYYRDIFEYYEKDGKRTTILHEMTKDGEKYHNFNEEQVRIYFLFEALSDYADALANLIRYSKVDTKKTGRTFVEQSVYMQMYESIKANHNGLFESASLERYFNDTFIDVKTKNSVGFASKLFSGMTIRTMPKFGHAVQSAISKIASTAFQNVQLNQYFTNQIEAQVKSRFFADYISKHNIDVRGMFVGDFTMAKRLRAFKSNIVSNKESFGRFLNADGKIQNALLNLLIPEFNVDGMDFISTSENLSQSQLDMNDFISAWEELLEDQDERVKKFASDLAVYAFYTSGDNFVANSFFHYLPNSHKRSIGYSDFIGNYVKENTEFAKSDYDADEIILNSTRNSDVVKRIELFNREINDNMVTVQFDKTALVPDMIFGAYFQTMYKSAIKPIRYDENRIPVYPKYVKVRDVAGKWHMYEKVGTYVMPNPAKRGTKNHIPVYGIVAKQGYNNRGFHIYEYGIELNLPINEQRRANYANALTNLQKLSEYAPNSEIKGYIFDMQVYTIGDEVTGAVDTHVDDRITDIDQLPTTTAEWVIEQEFIELIGDTYSDFEVKQKWEEFKNSVDISNMSNSELMNAMRKFICNML